MTHRIPYRYFRAPAALVLLALLALGAQAADEATTETGAMRYPIDRNHTTVGFEASVLGVSKVTGKFADFAGAIIVHDPADLTSSEVAITIESKSIDTGIDDRDEYLRGPDFFDVETHPEVTFASNKVERLEMGQDLYQVTGDFTMGGVTKEISFPFRITDHSDVVALEARLEIDRTEYGVAWSRVMDDGNLFVAHEVEIEIYLLTRVGKPWSPGDVAPAPGTTNEPDGP